ncbi:hypothetical protein HKX48_008567 [Thoreauomyces humboldtii]|nr:hypothetical protein HKX48_008567 [Thoreauomyces humboldtii]
MGIGTPAVIADSTAQNSSASMSRTDTGPSTPNSEAYSATSTTADSHYSSVTSSVQGQGHGRGNANRDQYDFAAAVGVWVRIETFGRAPDNVFEGLVFSYDPMFGAVVLQSISADSAEASKHGPSSTTGSQPSRASTPGPPAEGSSPAPVAKPAAAPNGKPVMSFAAAAAAAAARTSASPSPSASKKSSAPSSPRPVSNAATNGTSSPTQSVSGKSSSPTPASAIKFDFHLVKLNFIKEVYGLARIGDEGGSSDAARGRNGRPQNMRVPRPLPALVPVGPVSMEKAAARSAAAIARVGNNVSPDAQAIFDHLAKTLPTRWRESVIVIMDEIEIVEPYGVAQVRVVQGKGSGEGEFLARVKKVLEGVRTRLGMDGK